jgi:PAS domain S-box-containing protein
MQELTFEGHFKDLFDNTNDLIHFVNIQGDIELVNTAWLYTLDYELYEVVGRGIYDFIHPEYVEQYKIKRERVIATSSSDNFNTAFITRNGKMVFAEGHLSVNKSGNGTMYTRGVLKNITASKSAAEKLVQSESRLKALFTSAPDGIIVIDE